MTLKKKEKVHFIAIGGSVMHSLAIALKKKGLEVTGSDDNIYDPSKQRLAEHGLLPKEYGWDEQHITEDLDAVILGMHAKDDRSIELAPWRERFPDSHSYKDTEEGSKPNKRFMSHNCKIAEQHITAIVKCNDRARIERDPTELTRAKITKNQGN